MFGEKVPLPPAKPDFAFAIPVDGALPLDGAAPSLIDHQGDRSFVADIPDLGARLRTFTLEHPDPAMISRLYREFAIADPPQIVKGDRVRYQALIETSEGMKLLT